jgi:hypothetical protein
MWRYVVWCFRDAYCFHLHGSYQQTVYSHRCCSFQMQRRGKHKYFESKWNAAMHLHAEMFSKQKACTPFRFSIITMHFQLHHNNFSELQVSWPPALSEEAIFRHVASILKVSHFVLISERLQTEGLSVLLICTNTRETGRNFIPFFPHLCNIFNFECCILLRIYLNWFFMTPSIATKFQYINSLLFSFFTHYMFRPLRAIFRWDIQLVIWRTILIQRIRCTYAIWYRDVICCTSVLQLVVLIHVIKLNI